MTDIKFLTLKRAIIRKEFSNMNDRQFEAVTTAKGPVLVLAGAGSGKTTVLVNRIAYLVKYGNAYRSDLVPSLSEAEEERLISFYNGQAESCPSYILSVEPVNPYNILAITFTNKAAGELKERISARLGDDAQDIWAGTFHSVCGKILRRNALLIGYDSNFTIYDTDDQKRVIKDIIKSLRIDDKAFPVKSI